MGTKDMKAKEEMKKLLTYVQRLGRSERRREDKIFL